VDASLYSEANTYLCTFALTDVCLNDSPDVYGVVIDVGAAETEVVSNGNCPTITYDSTADVAE